MKPYSSSFIGTDCVQPCFFSRTFISFFTARTLNEKLVFESERLKSSKLYSYLLPEIGTSKPETLQLKVTVLFASKPVPSMVTKSPTFTLSGLTVKFVTVVVVFTKAVLLESPCEVTVTFTLNVPTAALPTLSATTPDSDAFSVICVRFKSTTFTLS